MGFREPLDLSEITKQYDVFRGESTAGVNYVKGDRQVDLDAPVHEPIPRHLYRDAPVLPEQPVAVRKGPLTCSTCVDLVPDPVVCWDVNGYYRSLGVHWKATRRELMRGYQHHDGQRSVYLTYVLKQLLNAEVRREYDRTPLGEPFLDDIYVQDALKRKASQEAARRTKAGTYTTAKQVIEEDYNFYPDTPSEVVDGEDEVVQGDHLSDPPSTLPEWKYGYFRWRSNAIDTARLARWQELLVRALAERKERVRLAVGWAGKMPHQYVVSVVGDQRVVFLNDREHPSEDLADSAVAALMREMNPVNAAS